MSVSILSPQVTVQAKGRWKQEAFRVQTYNLQKVHLSKAWGAFPRRLLHKQHPYGEDLTYATAFHAHIPWEFNRLFTLWLIVKATFTESCSKSQSQFSSPSPPTLLFKSLHLLYAPTTFLLFTEVLSYSLRLKHSQNFLKSVFLILSWSLFLYLLELCFFTGNYANSTTVPVFEIPIINASIVVLKVNLTFWLMPGRQKLLWFVMSNMQQICFQKLSLLMVNVCLHSLALY